MMSGVPLETCWAFNKLWNNKFYYKLHLVGISTESYYDARIHEYQLERQNSKSEHYLTQLKSPNSNYGQTYKNLPRIGYSVVPTSGDHKAAMLMTRCKHAVFNDKGDRWKVTLSNGPRNKTKPTVQHAALDMMIRWWSDPVERIDLSVRGFVLTVAELSRTVC